MLDELVAVLAYMVTRPTPPVRWLVPVLRRLETRDPSRDATLLGPLRSGSRVSGSAPAWRERRYGVGRSAMIPG